MDTDDLIGALAAQTRPIPPRAAETRIALGMIAGMAIALAAVLLWLGLLPDFRQALGTYPFWMKASYTLSIALLAAVAVAHFARPDVRSSGWLWWLAAPVLLLACLAVWELSRTPAADWLDLWLGQSARQCPFRIITLAIPIYGGLVWSFRRLAPMQPGIAGGAAGAAAGAAAATLYALHCPEVSASFVLTWYSLGIVASALAGAAAGRFLLRW